MKAIEAPQSHTPTTSQSGHGLTPADAVAPVASRPGLPVGAGFIPVSEAEVALVAGLAPAEVLVWAVGLCEAAKDEVGLVRLSRDRWVQRCGLEPNRGNRAQVAARVRAVAAAGLWEVVEISGGDISVRVAKTTIHQRGSLGWTAQLHRDLVARAIDPDDLLTGRDIRVWLRWQFVLRADAVIIPQRDLARRWGMAQQQVSREFRRLVQVDLVATDGRARTRGSLWAAGMGAVDRHRRLGGAGQGVPALPPIPVFSAPDSDNTAIVDLTTPPSSAPLGTPSTRAGVSLDPAIDPCGDSVSPPESVPGARGEGRGAASEKKSAAATKQATAGGRDEHWQAGKRLVRGVEWLATAPEVVRWPVVSTLAGYLRRGVLSEADAARVLAFTEPTGTAHVQTVRGALACAVADRKAAPEPVQRPEPAPEEVAATVSGLAQCRAALAPGESSRQSPGESSAESGVLPVGWAPAAETRAAVLAQWPEVDLPGEVDAFTRSRRASGRAVSDWEREFVRWCHRAEQFAQEAAQEAADGSYRFTLTGRIA